MNWKSKLILGVLTALAMMFLTYTLPRGGALRDAALVQFPLTRWRMVDLRFAFREAQVSVVCKTQNSVWRPGNCSCKTLKVPLAKFQPAHEAFNPAGHAAAVALPCRRAPFQSVRRRQQAARHRTSSAVLRRRLRLAPDGSLSFAAAALPADQGIKAVLENSKVLRVFVGNEIRAECIPDKGRCAAKREGFTLQGEVNKRIDEIVREEMVHTHKTASVDYPLQGQLFPFSEIAALKSENRQDAYLILQLADHSYTATQLQDKYGVPYDTNIFQSHSVFTYRLNGADYTSRAVFEVDPVDGAVMKIAISLKAKKNKKRD